MFGIEAIPSLAGLDRAIGEYLFELRGAGMEVPSRELVSTSWFCTFETAR
jgi:hypothetical protein